MAFAYFLLAAGFIFAECSGVLLDLPITFHNTYVRHHRVAVSMPQRLTMFKSSIDIQVGTPPKTYRLHPDTGSGTSWVVDTACANTCENGSGYNRVGYMVNDSRTGMLTGDFGDIEYLGGRTAGPVASDIITVGNFSWRQSFLAANESSWSVMPTDGFLGLAFNSFRVGNADTFMHTLLPQLDEPKFGIFLGEDGNNATGLLTLGGSHEDRYSDDEPTKIPIVKGRSNEFDAWRSVIQGVTVKGFKTGGKNVSDTVSFDRGNVVFDTSAGAIQLPSDKIEAAYELMGVNYTAVLWGDRVLSCSEFNSSWSVSFSFSPDDTTETRVVTLRGDELARPGFPAAENACWPPFEDSGSDGFTLLGSPLLKKFYAVWDFGAFDEAVFTPTLGLAKLRK